MQENRCGAKLRTALLHFALDPADARALVRDPFRGNGTPVIAIG